MSHSGRSAPPLVSRGRARGDRHGRPEQRRMKSQVWHFRRNMPSGTKRNFKRTRRRFSKKSSYKACKSVRTATPSARRRRRAHRVHCGRSASGEEAKGEMIVRSRPDEASGAYCRAEVGVAVSAPSKATHRTSPLWRRAGSAAIFAIDDAVQPGSWADHELPWSVSICRRTQRMGSPRLRV